MKKIAIILSNLGGPDTQEAVKPFLFNLFYDPAILRVKNPLRWLLATLISTRRAPIAREIYQKIGGSSPIVPATFAQANALEQLLASETNFQVKVFIHMRYWHPLSESVAQQIVEYQPEEIVILPLYPQFSSTTSASSVTDLKKAFRKKQVTAPIKLICCYPTEPAFIESHVTLLRPLLEQAKVAGEYRLLFSAHGLPEKIIKEGDPYQYQVENSAKEIVKALAIENLDWNICYQSRVGPLKWIGPSTDAEILRAGQEKKSVVLVPIAFVSEHSETLVELDIEYRHLAESAGVPLYLRVPTVSTENAFIENLARLCKQAIEQPHKKGQCVNLRDNTPCPTHFSECPYFKKSLCTISG